MNAPIKITRFEISKIKYNEFEDNEKLELNYQGDEFIFHTKSENPSDEFLKTYGDNHEDIEVASCKNKASNLIITDEVAINIIPILIKSQFEKDAQFLRYFRNLFSDLYDEMKGIEITIDDSESLNQNKEVLYEKVPESRLEFLMYLNSVTQYMIQEEKLESEENEISLN